MYCQLTKTTNEHNVIQGDIMNLEKSTKSKWLKHWLTEHRIALKPIF